MLQHVYLLYNFTKTSYIQPKKIHSTLERSIVILVLILIASLSLAMYFQPASAANNTILINEVELNPEGVDVGVEKIELHNPSNNAIDVNGWTLGSTAGETDTIIINVETTIPPNGYVLIGTDSGQWLDNTGELIELRNDSGILIDYAGPFSDGANDDGTWQRSADDGEEEGGRNWVFSTNTLGRANFGNFIPNESSPVFPSEHPIIEPETSFPEVTTTNSSIEAVNSSN